MNSRIQDIKSIYQKIVFLYTWTGEQNENEINKSFIYSSIKNDKVFMDKFNKRTAKLTLWKLKHCCKKVDLNKWKDILCSWIRRFNIVTMVDYTIPFKIWADCKNLTGWSLNLDGIQGTQNKQVLKKNKVGRLANPNCKIYYEPTVMKVVWYLLA